MNNVKGQNPPDPEDNDVDDRDDSWQADTIRHIPRVLIVEDTVELGEFIQRVLEKLHFLTFRETQGSRALTLYQKIRADLVLLDIGLPDMNGWRVLDEIKQARGEKSRPAIVVITAYGDPANRLMGKLQGVDNYLMKPFTAEDLDKVIRQIFPNLSKTFGR